MKKKLATLFTAALVTGLITNHLAKAEETNAQNVEGSQIKTEKNNCKGIQEKKKLKKKEKNSCKNGCGEAKEKSEQKSE